LTSRIFITGTDTGVGKTQVSLLLLEAFRARGLSTAVLKPVAAGAELKNGCLQNDDAELLQKAATMAQPYEEINPYVFESPIAPHIAASQQGVELNVKNCMQACQQALDRQTDVLLVEGAGGWLVPLNSSETLADLAIAMNVQVVLVVALRLGCINHALLTAASIEASGLNLLGWVANHVDGSVLVSKQIVAAIGQRLSAPLLGQIPFSTELGNGPLQGSHHDNAQIVQLADCVDSKKIL
jgi:dethiobiotin synthetase